MTSATDLNPILPPVRPESATPKAALSKEEGPSFADVLETETTAPESEDDVITTETATATLQPAPPPATPAINSPEAILAGLTLDSPATQATGAATTTNAPAVNTATPQIAPAETAAPAAVSTPAIPPAAQAAAAKPAQQKATLPGEAPVETAGDATPVTDDCASAPPTSPIVATAATPAPAMPFTTTQTAAPATASAPEAAPLSAPGAERAAAPLESAAAPETKPAAANTNTADTPKAQSADTKTTTLTAEAAPDINTDAAPSSNTSTSADTLAAPRNAAADTTRTAQNSPALQSAPPATIQVYQRMIDRIDGRAQRFEIRLDPAELGRVDVRIEVGADKKVHAVLAAHDSAALTDLMRGQRSLERALADAGIDLAEGGIKFELSNDPGRNAPGNQGNGDAGSNANAANVWRGFSAVNVAVDAQTTEAARSWRSSSRLDLVA